MHSFTELTPTSLAARAVVEVFVPDWEIECCVPPPAVGARTGGALQFVTTAPTAPEPDGFDRDGTWQVTRQGELTLFRAGAVVALWAGTDGPPPAPGTARLRGRLFATAHALGPDVVARTSGTVLRVRLVSRRFRTVETDGGPALVPVAGTVRAVDVGASPRWFASPCGPVGTSAVHETGVLLDLVPDPAVG